MVSSYLCRLYNSLMNPLGMSYFVMDPPTWWFLEYMSDLESSFFTM